MKNAEISEFKKICETDADEKISYVGVRGTKSGAGFIFIACIEKG